MVNCSICEKHKNQSPIYQGKHTIVSPAAFNEGVLGYLYVEPIRHVEDWYQLTEEEFSEITSLLSKISKFLKDEIKAERVYTVTISEMVRHLHIHLIPRNENLSIKGVDLIEHATTCREYPEDEVSNEAYQWLFNKLKQYLSIEKIEEGGNF
ncbi:HIT family protein [Rossellomorea arthrocnemi]